LRAVSDAEPPIRRTLVWTTAIIVGLVAFGFRLIDVRDLSNDHYMHLAWAQQVLFGEVPGRDFVDPGLPLMYTLSAIVQWLSPGPFAEAALSCALLGLAAAITCIVATNLTGSLLLGVSAALLEIVLYPRLYSYPKILVPAVELLLVQQYVRRPGRLGLVLLAVWADVAVLLRHDLGIYAAAGTGVALVWTHWRARTAMVRALLEFAAAAIVVMIPYVAFVQWSEGLPRHVHEALEFAKGEAHQRFVSPPPFAFVSDPGGLSAWSKVDSAVFLFYAAHLLALAALVLLILRRERRTERSPTIGAAFAMLVLYLVIVLRHPIDSRIQDVAALLAILGAWVISDLGHRALARRSVGEGGLARRSVGEDELAHRSRGEGGTHRRPIAVAGLVLALAVTAGSLASLWDLGNIGLRLQETRVTDGVDTMRRTLVGVKETGTEWPWERFWPAGELPDAVRYLNACTAPDDTVLLTWAAPEYYYFARRKFGAGHALFLPPDAFTTIDDQHLMLARMRAEHIPVVLINETRRGEFAGAYGEVDRYLRQEYTPAGHFQIRDGSDVTVAIRRGLKPERTYGAERWPCGFDSRAASKTASIMLDGSAMPFPAMSNAVP
jgi:hypothetical protein